MSRNLATLDSHLPPALRDALARVVEVASTLELGVYVSGSTMRDTFAGMSPRVLDFVVEGSTSKLRAALPHGLPVNIYEACEERYPKPGGKPRQIPGSIHDYLRTRDFSVNAIALSVTRSSRGLLIDPANGTADIANRELRAINGHVFTDRPIRLLTLLRLKVRHGFSVYPRTQGQFDDAMEGRAYRLIRPPDLLGELRKTALEPQAPEILEAWNQAGLLPELLPVLSGERLNSHGFAKLQKLRATIPFGIDFPVDEELLFFAILTEGFSPKDRKDFIEGTGMDAHFAASWQRLTARVTKLERELTAASSMRPSNIYRMLHRAGGAATLLLAVRSTNRTAQDRVRNYLTRYLAVAAEAKGDPELTTKLLNARPKRVPPPGTEPLILVTGGAEAEAKDSN